MLNMRVLSTGNALPDRVVTTTELAARAGLDPQRVLEATGVAERRWVAPDDDPVTFGAAALDQALAAANMEITELDVLIHASGSFPQPIPDGSSHLAEAVGFRGRPAFSVHSTCVSALVGIHQAALLVAAGQARRVAVVSCEVSSRGLNLADPESSLLFGDGAAAVIVGEAERPDQGIERYVAQMWPEGGGATEIRAGGYRRPRLDAQCPPEDFTFRMNGRRALMLGHKLVPRLLEELQPGLSSGLDGIDLVIPHQASAAGMKLLQRYNWPSERIESTLERLGNVIAASIPLTLHQALTTGRISAGHRVLFVGTGAGLTTTGMIVRW